MRDWGAAAGGAAGAALSLAAAAAAAAAVVAAAALAAAVSAAAAAAVSAAVSAATAAARRRRAPRRGKRAAAAAVVVAVAAAVAAAAAVPAAAADAAPRAGADAGAPAAPADPRGEPARAAPHWRFLGGVGAGDTFEYRICDSLYGPRGARHGSGWTCYAAALRIEAVVPVSGGRDGGGADVHVVRAAADAGAPPPPAPPDAILLVVDGGHGRLAVRHAAPADRPLAESLQRTVFWRGGLGGGFQLAYGEPAAELVQGRPSTALLVSGSRVSAGGMVEYTAAHGPPQPQPLTHGSGGGGDGRRALGQGASEVVVADGIGLPVSARIYGGAPPPLDHYHPGRPLFEYELVSFGRGGEGGGSAGEGAGGGAGGPHAGAGRAEEGAPIFNPHYPVHGGRRGGGCR